MLVFRVTEGGKVDMTKQLKGHGAPISDVVAKGNQVVSADDQGMIVLWQDVATSAEAAITINDSKYVVCCCVCLLCMLKVCHVFCVAVECRVSVCPFGTHSSLVVLQMVSSDSTTASQASRWWR